MQTPIAGMENSRDRLRWIALILVFGAAMINYIDRQAIALLKPTLEVEFGWSDLDYAHIVSGFQLATAASMLAAGWFVDRLGLRVGYAIGVSAWSLAGIAHALVTSVAGFVGVRIALGVAEAVNTPAAVKTVATWFRGSDRSVALGIMNMAPNIGAVATPLIVPALAVALGWQMAFVATGALGFVWLVAWLLLPRPVQVAESHIETEARSPTGIRSLRSILTNRNAWAFAIAKLLTDFVWAFLLFWGPDLFNKRYGLDTASLALPRSRDLHDGGCWLHLRGMAFQSLVALRAQPGLCTQDAHAHFRDRCAARPPHAAGAKPVGWSWATGPDVGGASVLLCKSLRTCHRPVPDPHDRRSDWVRRNIRQSERSGDAGADGLRTG